MGSFMVTHKKEGLTWFVAANTTQEAKDNIAKIGYDIGDLPVRHATSRDIYLNGVPNIIETYRKEASRFQRRFNQTQITVIYQIKWLLHRFGESVLA